MIKEKRISKNKCVYLLFVAILSCLLAFNNSVACECPESGNCYEVTDNTSFDAVPWQNLSEGDTIRIHYQAVPYLRSIIINDSGTSGNPITICGVPDNSGNLPSIQGTSSTAVILLDTGVSYVTVSGLKISGGQKGIQARGYSGAMCQNLIIANNIIENNGDNSNDRNNHGGGLEIYGDSAEIKDNIITNNFAGNGGGLWIRGINNEILRNTIKDNIGYRDHGGGLYVLGQNVTISGNLIEGNKIGPFEGGGWGGGIILAEATNVSLSNNIVRKNYAYNQGAGVFVDEASSATLEHELIYNNIATRYGAGISVDERADGLVPSSAEITNCVIAYNYSSYNHPNGSGNGIVSDYDSTAIVKNSIIYGNKRLLNCELTETSIPAECDFSGPADDFRITNNSDQDVISISFSIISESWEGAGNIQSDPLFVDSEHGNFHLTSTDSITSPGIDAGDPASVFQNEPEDNGDRINIGLYGNTTEASRASGETEVPLEAPQNLRIIP